MWNVPKLWKRILSPSFKKVYYSRQESFLASKTWEKIHFPKANFMWIKSHENTLIRASSSSRLKALFSHSTFISLFFCIRKSLQNQCWLQSGLVLLGYSYSKPDFLIAFSQRKLAEKSCAALYFYYTPILLVVFLHPFSSWLFKFFAPFPPFKCGL